MFGSKHLLRNEPMFHILGLLQNQLCKVITLLVVSRISTVHPAMNFAAVLIAAMMSAPASGQMICTADVRACPDGSYVSRDPTDGCKFSKCPSPTPTTGKPTKKPVTSAQMSRTPTTHKPTKKPSRKPSRKPTKKLYPIAVP